ncbi:oxidoreductase [Paractinoplanes abujensis]|uniref:NAD(P)-dependent dehydrogenase (Short-subunit alcohol dehydrogenase family) n=1 Tax=Paractinoplanes abujensis TaxID=882441 RepID=A0A7W7CML5_9ACTN|nr:SDR family NAD(P)-dependent oxidoreductase [Actinoplanes abujensis]MBB4691303.1 NAD(P)-dependent dehydrogenase (short-subunit alcohol dehydrogenase family) [Actinoplanes abujensis]GID17282.1 oxidoreductase [Actinoplanes abujensis]
MTTLAVVGAGPGLGAAVARRFGAAGFEVALISRNPGKLGGRGYPADVRDPEALHAALTQAADELGPIEVLQYSPIPHRDFLKPVADTTPQDVVAAVEFSVLGPMTAVNAVLPGMRQLGRGAILFVNGGSGARPDPKVAGTSIAFAGEGAYGKMLHETLGPEGIRVAQLIIPGAIRPADTDGLAEQLWRLHATDGEFRTWSDGSAA